jgi:gliding motility-associated-like protein
MARSLSTLVMMLCLLVQGYATHIIGGEIYYDHLGGNQYLVTLDLYRDCGPANSNNTGFDATATIGVFNSSGNLVQQLSIPYNGQQVIPVVVANPCLAAPPSICVATTRYQATVTLAPSPGGYTLAYQRCCRTPAIVNLQQPGNLGVTCKVRIPGTPDNINSSPRFDNYPPLALCVNEEIVFDHSATDPDGDVIVYELFTPFQGGTNLNPMPVPPTAPPYTPVPWAAGYSAQQPLPSNPPVALDPNTGALTLRPTQVGIYTVGVRAREFRNGVLLSELERDFMFTVVNCDPNILAVVADQDPGQLCTGLTQSFGNLSVNGQFYFWDFGDATTLADTSNLANPTWTYAQPGTYTVTLIANPGWPCADTSTAVYEVYLPVDPQFTPPDALCGAQQVTLTATGGFSAAADVAWNLGAGAVPVTAQGQTVTAFFDALGVQPVTVTVVENGCSGSFTANVGVFPIPVPAIAPQSVFCGTLTMDFAHQSQGGGAYLWDFGDPSTTNDQSNLPSPSWTYAAPGTYTVTLTVDPNGPCPASTTAVFNVYLSLDPGFIDPPILCPGQNATFTVGGSLFDAGASVQWNFGPTASPMFANGSTATTAFATAGIHPVTVTVQQNGCEGTYTGLAEVHPFPVAAFTSDSRACVGNWFGFQNLSEALTPMTFVWTLGDGTTSTDVEPLHQYQEPGSYTVSLTVSTSEGCIASNTTTVVGQVEVFARPIPGFTALPREVSVFDPRIEVEDGAQNTAIWMYTIDGSVVFDPSFSWWFEEGGQYPIWQIVTSPDGCVDSTMKVVIVSDHIFWAPNAFTPDGDGLNDEWLPVVIGARDYMLEIFDRWGELRFRTTDPRQGWSGDGQPASVFTYKVWIKEWGAFSKEYIGHFTLLR